MKLKELIEMLSGYDPEADVMIDGRLATNFWACQLQPEAEVEAPSGAAERVPIPGRSPVVAMSTVGKPERLPVMHVRPL